jgi:hypothetical protein
MDRRKFVGVNALGVMGAAIPAHTASAQTDKSDYINDPAKKLEVIESADIVILGGGPAGCAAAVAAGRMGADVLLVERYGYLGGLMTGGLVILIGEYDRRLTGLPKEFTERSLASGECRYNVYPYNRRVPDEPIGNPEMYKQLFYEMAEDAGVRFLFHSWAVGASVKDDKIDGVIIESKSGRQAIRAKMVIDCTGDADTAPWTGVPFEDTTSGWSMAVDEIVGDIDFDAYEHFVEYNPDQWNEIMAKARKENIGWSPWKLWRNDWAWFNTSYGGYATDVKTLSACEIDIRKRLKTHLAFFKANVPGFERAMVVKTADQTGVRVSRRIMGDHVITKESLEDDNYKDVIGKNIVFKGQPLTKLPYRALLPKKIDNLLYAGRCISCTAEAQNLIRGITACWIYGQAAGIAANLSLKENTTPAKLDIDALQSGLRDQGVVL